VEREREKKVPGLDRFLEAAFRVLDSNRVRWPLALAVGVFLWAMSLPPYGWGILGVFAFIPILYVLPDVRPVRAALWGWAGGTAWQLATLWWLVPTIVRYGSINIFVACLLILLLCMLLGLYMAGFLWTLSFLVYRGLGDYALLMAPFAWVLWEWLQGHLFTGFPWWGPGYALSLYTPLLQDARLFGILGLSFLAVLLATAVAMWLRNRRSPLMIRLLPLTLILFAAAFFWGYRWEKGPVDSGPAYRVGYLQPNISQDEKWNRASAKKIMQRLLLLSRVFHDYRLKLLVWPESCTPFSWDEDPAFKTLVGNLSHTIDAPILLGTELKKGDRYQNGAVVVLPDGSEGGRYAKTHLVPFGEYVPLRKLFFFAKPIVQEVGDFEPGHSLEPLKINGAKVGVTICFEAIFPELVRQEVRNGAHLLVNISNDAWYDGTPGPIQHFLIERVRAVETGRYLVRSANGGISGVVDPHGSLVMSTPQGEAASFWGEAHLRTQTTLFTKIGDWWLFIPLLLVLFAATLGGRPFIRK
jgi:apolipoprotein N-acyltransferase